MTDMVMAWDSLGRPVCIPAWYLEDEAIAPQFSTERPEHEERCCGQDGYDGEDEAAAPPPPPDHGGEASEEEDV